MFLFYNLHMDKSIFELIIDGQIPSMKIYEDDNYVAFLDIAPKQKGHTLLVPKIKSENIIKDSTQVKETILEVASKLSNVLMEKLGATGIKMVMNNGSSAGQEVFHTHLHLIPYYEDKVEAVNNEEVLAEIVG